MRFLLEFRDLIRNWATPGTIHNSLQQHRPSLNFQHVVDQTEVFSNLNDGPILFTVETIAEEGEGLPFAKFAVRFEIHRNTTYASYVVIDDDQLSPAVGISFGPAPSDTRLVYNGQPRADVTFMYRLLTSLSETLYIGSFRNTINV